MDGDTYIYPIIFMLGSTIVYVAEVNLLSERSQQYEEYYDQDCNDDDRVEYDYDHNSPRRDSWPGNARRWLSGPVADNASDRNPNLT